jgi:hypothetical protein
MHFKDAKILNHERHEIEILINTEKRFHHGDTETRRKHKEFTSDYSKLFVKFV